MTYEFKIWSSDDPEFVPPEKGLLPMTAVSFKACLTWLERSIAGKFPDSYLLTQDLRQCRLRGATPGSDEYGQFINFCTLERSGRLVTPAQFCLMRLLSLPGRDCEWWFESATKKKVCPENHRYSLKFGRRREGNLYGVRVLADAKWNEKIRQRCHRVHKDLRPHNLRRSQIRKKEQAESRPRRGRADAIDYALRAFGDGVEGLELKAQEYEALLASTSALVDQSSHFLD